WWDDLWLNESFAEWAAHHASVKATRFTEAWTGFTNARKNWAYRQDQLPSTHPIAADNYDLEAVEGNFDGITYAKGASTLKQLVAWVGEEPFLAGLSAYFAEHAFANAEFGDLLSALTAASGRELDSWATEWLTTSGVNTLAADFAVDDAGAFTRFAIRQTALAEFPTLRRHRIRVGLYDAVDGRLVRRTSVETDISGESTDIAELVGQDQPDLVLLNDGDLTYAKIRLDERSLATLVASIATLDDSLARALCWGAAWDMTRDAELAATDFVTLVLSGIGSETDITAVQALLTYARSSADSYSAPDTRAALRATWEEGVRELLHAAEPGSDHQLAFLRSFAASAHTTGGLDLVQGLYDGTETVAGLEVNQDLRWSLLHALAAGGRADESAIEAELGRDNTIAGQEKAAGARASIPSSAAKQWAWEAAVLGNDLPNETMRSVCASFQVAGQEDLLAPYVAQYLEVAETIIETKGVWIARVNLELTFPRAIATQETLDAVTAWLADTKASPAAVRYVKEGQADLVRALAAQKKDQKKDQQKG
ncbi:MAG: Membrane alanyl aminopeptidase Metallo peptidase family, partial [Marmoricola sp.]|nr:Membrane alanyl aminopeptidase Metallo peptidase family [Marmoricola sp.]